jgi:hypothetical protein
VVKHLVTFLGVYDQPALQYEAAWAITNITSGNDPRQTHHVVERGALPVLVELIARVTHDNVLEQALWCLGNIAGTSAQCRDTILSVDVTAGPTYSAGAAAGENDSTLLRLAHADEEASARRAKAKAADAAREASYTDGGSGGGGVDPTEDGSSVSNPSGPDPSVITLRLSCITALSGTEEDRAAAGASRSGSSAEQQEPVGSAMPGGAASSSMTGAAGSGSR